MSSETKGPRIPSPIEVYKDSPTLAEDLGLTNQGQSRLHSPAYLLAGRLISDATDGLIGLNRGEKSPMSGVMLQDKPKRYSEEGLRYGEKLEATLYFGATIRAIENIISTGYYDHYRFSTDVDHVIGQYDYTQVNGSINVPPEKVDESILEMMQSSAMYDPYFANIIEQGKLLLPKKLHDALLNSGHMDRIMNILSRYIEITEDLPEVDPGDMGNQQYQAMKLRKFDREIDRMVSNLDAEIEAIRKKPKDENVGKSEESESPQDRIEALALGLIENGGNHYRDNIGRQNKRTFNQDLYRTQEATAKAEIFLGATIIALKDMMRSGKYDHPSFARRVNKALGSEMIKVDSDGNDSYDLPSDYHGLMFSIGQEDRTLSLFFEDPRILPPQIRDELIHHDLVEPIGEILAGYKRTANEMISGEEYDVVLEATKVAVFAQDNQRMADL